MLIDAIVELFPKLGPEGSLLRSWLKVKLIFVTTVAPKRNIRALWNFLLNNDLDRGRQRRGSATVAVHQHLSH